MSFPRKWFDFAHHPELVEGRESKCRRQMDPHFRGDDYVLYQTAINLRSQFPAGKIFFLLGGKSVDFNSQCLKF